MAQPPFEEEHPDITNYQKMHRRIYLPLLHSLLGFCLVGMAASIASLLSRWRDLHAQPFSPAYVAFCVSMMFHANAIQAYRAALNSFSTLTTSSPFRTALFSYWLSVLVTGTVLTVSILVGFLCSLPKWTHLDVQDEIEPPEPYETSMSLTNMISAGETLIQPFVSPAILQANETGILYLSYDDQGSLRYKRTRRFPSLGFEHKMNPTEFDREREYLQAWARKNPPRRRSRSLSVPGIDFTYANLGAAPGVYAIEDEGVVT